jgi:LCP family protein required for cell wall assembly
VGAVFLVGFLVVGLRLYFGFKAAADVPFSPPDASAALAERTSDEVEEGRREIAEQDELEVTEPPLEEVVPPVEDAVEAMEEPEPEPGETIEVEPEEPEPEPVDFTRSTTRLPDSMFDTVLMMGADASGYLADSIIFALFPEGGAPPAIISIPRDLYLYNFCSEDFRRVNANLGGCTGYANGPELLALTIEDFTGVEVDHFARVDFEGFVELVDGLGGVEVCFDYPTRDEKAELDVVEPGCYSDGATALAYARSRNAQQLVDGEWRQAWSSDFARQGHQRELLLNLAGGLKDSSRIELLGSLQNLSHTLRLDRGWSVTEAVDWALRYRDLSPSRVAQLRIPVEDYRSPNGAQVLVPTSMFRDILSEWWSPAGG